MKDQGPINALVLEREASVTEKVTEILKKRSYMIATTSKKEEALSLLKEGLYPLAIVGELAGSHSLFEFMREIIMTSPMTSVILITDLSKAEVHEKAEGYGILGHVSRAIQSEGLIPLLDGFEKIFKSLPQA